MFARSLRVLGARAAAGAPARITALPARAAAAPRSLATAATTADPMALFAAVDENGDGVVSRDEFQAMIDRLDEGTLREAAGSVFSVVDVNGDGVLSEQEFQDALGFYTHGELDRLRLSLARNELSGTSEFDEAAPAGMNLAHRFKITAEVAVSKIAPAGFGWQSASLVAEGLGYEATDGMFFLITGLGDGLGVFAGHSLYFGLKKAVTGDSGIKMGSEMQTGWWLGTAAVFSGTAWQPTVNFLHEAAGLSFTPCAVLTTAMCGVAFYTGLRLGRIAYSPFMGAIAEPSYGNLKADALLSVSIGGATGAFVGTDVSFGVGAADTNWLRPIVGIEEGASDLAGVVTAGASTALGFTALQTVENVVLPGGKNWVD